MLIRSKVKENTFDLNLLVFVAQNQHWALESTI